ncbi:hypothetical protein HNR37_000030 [Desulfurispira natronophila]|uniref:Zinc-ribbon domain-containing protein n=2 Tax=Desulfurispira natronophila TaxID=682562 RepID=A0A7W7Y2R5_9BACT|nr:hypothetical protein [Desulfurispira natronophila]
MSLKSFEPVDNHLWKTSASENLYYMCANSTSHGVCNWVVEVSDQEPFCVCCRLNGTIPDLSVAGNRDLWQVMETEKRRLIYSMLRLGLPVEPRKKNPSGLEFDFLADTPSSFNERGRVMTGHNQGLITINLAEADPAERERMRSEMAEPYRTILGHFRHESGHYYWDRLVQNSTLLEGCRELFGDDREDYAQALERHYENGPPENWQEQYVSSYASTHPWEDWAESWAHYLHIIDTLETAYHFGLKVRPRVGSDESMVAEHDFNPYWEDDFQLIIEHWLPLTFALNSLNRSMGHDHSYPFVLSQAAIEKLEFVHRVVRLSALE